ncbi:hypothetical protein QN277_029105 [Acacia crassicarpa]|uniref:tRNA(adenine(34)) deaminase n=1 Tax=Acacia crassicarpa TaxID=499986 RepID=A0AAE1J831_9FABA|nr:hypothetical protein QN277_029105 [Acacia crassicarpa]
MNAYISSTVYAIRSKGAFSLSFNDYSNVSYERFDRVPSLRSCCGCCDCCALSTCRVPSNPSLLFGLRQSTLLQLSASRRLILGGRDPYFTQLASYGLNRGFHELDCSFSERSVPKRCKRIIKQRCFCTDSEEESETNQSFGSDYAESVISLLSEEADRNVTRVRAKNVSSFKNLDLEKRKNGSRQRNQNLGKKEVNKGILKRQETLTGDLREDKKINEEKKAVAKGEHRKRRDVSSCSSYYSFSSVGDIGSDLEVEDKHEKSLEELSLGEDKASHKEEQVKEEYNRLRNDSEKLEEISKQERTAFHADFDCSLRKKYEKKLTEVTTEENFGKEPQDMRPTLSGRHESGYVKASTSDKQFESEDDTSPLIRHSHTKATEDHILTANKRNYQSTEIQESDGYEAENPSKLQNTFGGREGNLEISGRLFQEKNDERKSFVGSSTRKDVLSSNYQKNIEKSKIEHSESTSNTRMKNLEEDKTSVRSSVGNMEEHHYHKGDKVITQIEGRRKSQLSELSHIQETNVETASTVKSSNTIKNQEENLNLYSDVKGIRPLTDMRIHQSRKQSELGHSVSKGHASDERLVSRSQRVSEGVRLIKDSKLTSVNTRESYYQTDERIMQFLSSSEAQRPTNQSVSDENISNEAQSSRESLNLVSEGRKQHVVLAEVGEISSDAMLIPSSSKLIRRGSAYDEPNFGTSITEVCPNTSESGSSALYTNSGGRSPALQYELCSTGGSSQVYSDPSNILAPEDALASADRLEKSSKQFVDEFVQKARHEVTTETQKTEITGAKLSTEDEKNQVYSGRQQSTQKVSKSRERESSRSSGFSGASGAKGPSDEMWDELESSIKRSPPAEEAEASLGTENSIVKRTGRTLWGIISDVVRLRWRSHADASPSAARSGERNSSNKSDSDAWFSGQEHEETSKSKVIEERTGVASQATTSDQLQPKKSYTQSEGGVFDTMKLTDKGEHLEVGTSSYELGSGSTSIAISFASGEENTSWTEDGKDLQVSTSGAGAMELSIPLPAGPPIVEEIVNTGRIESLGHMEDPNAPEQTEITVTGKRDVELKQRKLQRNSQVMKDRFDEWEEAYKLEVEQRKMDEIFMREALLEANKAADTWEVPVGAVLVQDGKIIARGCNLVEELRDSTAHAEMICIREASSLLRTWRLAGTTLYVTLEPCAMCAGAILQARIDTLVWGAPNKLLGADGSWVRLFPDGGENGSETKEKPAAPVHPFHPKINIRRGVLASECAEVMQQFFHLRRKKKNEPLPTRTSHRRHHPSKLLHKMHDIFHIMFCL